MAHRKRLGEALIEANIISQEQLENALRFQEEKSKLLGQILIDMGWVTEEDVTYAMSKVLNVDYVNLDKVKVSAEALRLVPKAFAEEHTILPLIVHGGKVLYLAMENPLALNVIQQLEFKTGMPIKMFIAPAERLKKAIRDFYQIKGAGKSAPPQVAQEPPVKAGKEADELEDVQSIISDIHKVRSGSQIIRLVNLLIMDGIKARASDIVVDPGEEQLSVQFRIDGILYEKIKLPKWLHLPVFSRAKVMAGMNIAESRESQNGRTSLMYEKRKIDLRIATSPKKFGEKMEIRILDSQTAFHNLDDLGLPPEYPGVFREMIQKTHGWIIVTGPPGCGKTTTLYALLNVTKHVAKRIITIEDPIEYQLHGVTQYQVNPRTGLTFANGLRSILRERPDVILIGEIRDTETAALTMQASETGRLVLTTLHKKEATLSVERLFSLGIAPERVASNLLAVVAQRLVRRICPECKTTYTPDAEELRQIGLHKHQHPTFTAYKGTGCQNCNNTGYYGRIGVYEMLVPNAQLREAIAQRADKYLLKRLAVETGMKPMVTDGIEKISQGVTTIEEIVKVCEIEPIKVVRPAEPVVAMPEKTTKCSKCLKEVSAAYKFCPYCQHPLSTPCQKCGAQLEQEWLACPFCGTKRAEVTNDAEPGAPPPFADVQPPPSQGKVRVLLADDSKATRKILSFVLGRKGYEVILAADGDETLEKVRTERPNLLLLDIAMPKRDGFAVCKEVRSNSEFKDMPVIMLTGLSSLEEKLKGLASGANDYITKPFSLDELLARIEFVLRQTSAPEGQLSPPA